MRRGPATSIDPPTVSRHGLPRLLRPAAPAPPAGRFSPRFLCVRRPDGIRHGERSGSALRCLRSSGSSGTAVQLDGRGRMAGEAGDRRFCRPEARPQCLWFPTTTRRRPGLAMAGRGSGPLSELEPSLGAVVAQSTISRSLLRGEQWPHEPGMSGWRRGGSVHGRSCAAPWCSESAGDLKAADRAAALSALTTCCGLLHEAPDCRLRLSEQS